MSCAQKLAPSNHLNANNNDDLKVDDKDSPIINIDKECENELLQALHTNADFQLKDEDFEDLLNQFSHGKDGQ